MKMKHLSIAAMILMYILVFTLGWLIAEILISVVQPNPTPLPSITQIQQELVNRGHDIEVDGRLGPATQKAWDEETLKGVIYKNFESVMKADRKARGL